MTLAAPIPGDGVSPTPIRHGFWVPRLVAGQGWRLVKQVGDELDISPMRFSSSKTARQTAVVWNEEEGRGRSKDDGEDD